MKSRDTIMRLKRFQVDEKRRRVAQIEMMIADFARTANDLEREIAAEEQRAGISDKAHFAYPTYARAAMQRKEKLIHSADELKGQLEDARRDLEEAFQELKKFEVLDDREQARDRAVEVAREQSEMDRIGLAMRGSFARA
jgi:flagellar FliJ protein